MQQPFRHWGKTVSIKFGAKVRPSSSTGRLLTLQCDHILSNLLMFYYLHNSAFNSQINVNKKFSMSSTQIRTYALAAKIG